MDTCLSTDHHTPSHKNIFSFAIKHKSSLNNTISTSLPQQPTEKLAEIKFKIHSVGTHPEEDDDIDMCPARMRPYWPKKIMLWWVPAYPKEKPPFSYATLIAHAILSSKDGRLTISDIYTWISNTYPAYSTGEGGWQNSIRHNLSLNKKWFYKIDRTPTQMNPGKGCYWTLNAGTEQIFIDNLTYEGCHIRRKSHDIGFAKDLSIGQHRGSCYYNTTLPVNATVTPKSSLSSMPSPNQKTSRCSSICYSPGIPTPPPTPTKSVSSPLCATFRMVNMTEKAQHYYAQSQHQLVNHKDNSIDDSSNNDNSGVDVNYKSINNVEQLKKRRRTNNSSDTAANIKRRSLFPINTLYPSFPSAPQTHLAIEMAYDTQNPSPVSPSVSLTSTTSSSNDFNSGRVEHSLLYPSDNQLDNIHQNIWPVTTPEDTNNLWYDSFTELSISNKYSTTALNLDDETSVQNYPHFERNNATPAATNMNYIYNNSNNALCIMPTIDNSPITTSYCNLNSQISTSSFPITNNNSVNNLSSSSSPPPLLSFSAPLLHNHQLPQFVSLQDINL